MNYVFDILCTLVQSTEIARRRVTAGVTSHMALLAMAWGFVSMSDMLR